MKQIKQHLLLTVALLLCSIGIANAEVFSGSCGEKITWKLDTETGVLDFTGTGEMSNNYNAPWADYSMFITSVNIGYGITSIGEYSFNGYNETSSDGEFWGRPTDKYAHITSVSIPNTVTKIGYRAFSACSGLKSITIPNSVTTIEELAFSNCSGLTELHIPANVTYIGFMNTAGSNNLTKVTVDPSNKVFDSRNNCNAIINTSTNELVAGCKTTVIPNGITKLGIGCFDCIPLPDGFVIPNSVTSIDSRAFYRSDIRSIVIGKGMTSFEGDAFYGCTKLYEVYNLSSLNFTINSKDNGYVAYYAKVIHKSLDEPSAYENIGDFQFWNLETTQLIGYTGKETNITLPNDFKGKKYTIAADVFAWRSDITSVNIGNGVTGIGESAFLNCYGIKSLTIGSGVTSIGNYAFAGCSGLASVIFPNNVTSIGTSAFEGCFGLSSVTIGNGMTSIGNTAFKDCTRLYEVYNLSSLSLSPGRMSNGYVAFYAAVIHTSLSEPSIYENIGNFKFLNIETPQLIGYTGNESNITLPNTFKGKNYTIANEVFTGRSDITSVTIGSGVTSIGSRAFSGCSKLYEVYNLSSLKLSLGSMANGYVAYYAKVIHTSLSEPSAYENIGDFQFMNLETPQLIGYIGKGTNITLPNAFKGKNYIIANEVFFKNSDITSVNIGTGVTSIGNYAFAGCYGLTSVTIPNSVTLIERYAFAYCYGLTSVTIGNSVTSIGENAFEECYKLKSVTWNANKCNDFSSASPFPTTVKNVTFGNEVEYIPARLCDNLSELTSVTIPNSVTSIGSGSFYGCSSLSSIDIPSSVTTIEGTTFQNCSNLTSVTIPSSVTSIGTAAFAGCSNLTSVVIPSSVTSIGSGSFYGCSSLSSIDIPSSVKTIKEATFQNCSNLTSVTIPSSVTSIGPSAFAECSNLTSVVIPSSVTSIGTSAFSSCSNLANVYNYSKEPQRALRSFTKYGTLHVTKECVDNYKSSSYWRNFTILGDLLQKGDANGDGEITKADANMIVEHFIGKQTNIDPLAADTNNDGKVTMEDANIVINTLLSK